MRNNQPEESPNCPSYANRSAGSHGVDYRNMHTIDDCEFTTPSLKEVKSIIKIMDAREVLSKHPNIKD